MQGHCQGSRVGKGRRKAIKQLIICHLEASHPKLYLSDAILEILANFHVWANSFRLVPGWHSQ